MMRIGGGNIMAIINNYDMTKVNRIEIRKTLSGKLYTVIYTEFKNADKGIDFEDGIVLDESGYPATIPLDVIESLELVKVRIYPTK